MLSRCRALLHSSDKRKDFIDANLPTEYMSEAFVNPLSLDTPQTCQEVQAVAFLSSFYVREVYAYSIFNLTDIYSYAASQTTQKLSPKKFLESSFISPRVFIRNPNLMPVIIGEERTQWLYSVLNPLLEAHEITPRSLACPQGAGKVSYDLVSFMRGVALADALHDPLVLQLGHVVEALLQKGQVGASLYVEGDYNDRGVYLARSFMKLAEEFGSDRLLYVSLLLMKRFDMPVGYEQSKRIATALFRLDRRELDWKMKTTGGRGVVWKKGSNCSYMDPATLQGGQRLTEALAKLESKYKCAVSPFPSSSCTYRVVFSRPTNEAPESPTFVAINLTYDAVKSLYSGYADGCAWPLNLTVSENNTLENFPEAYIDALWKSKEKARSVPLWS